MYAIYFYITTNFFFQYICQKKTNVGKFYKKKVPISPFEKREYGQGIFLILPELNLQLFSVFVKNHQFDMRPLWKKRYISNSTEGYIEHNFTPYKFLRCLNSDITHKSLQLCLVNMHITFFFAFTNQGKLVIRVICC